MSVRINIGDELMTIEQAEILLERLKADPPLNGGSIDVDALDAWLKNCKETLNDFTISY